MPGTPDHGSVLAFDVGTRRIGVAVGNRITASARALEVVANHPAGPDQARIDALVGEWQPACFVVGLPLDLDGAEQPITRVARAFAQQLEQRYGKPVHLADERYSSVEAARRFAAQRAAGGAKRKHAAELDAYAAAVILDTWLAQPTTPSP